MKMKAIIPIFLLIASIIVVINFSGNVNASETYTVGNGMDYNTLGLALKSGDLSTGDLLIIEDEHTETGSFAITVEGLTIRGESSLTFPQFTGVHGEAVFDIQEKDVTLENLEIIGASGEQWSDGIVSDVVSTEIDNVVVKNCKIHDCRYGIIIMRTNQNSNYPRGHEIIDCEIYDNTYGIQIDSYIGQTQSLWGLHIIQGCSIHDNSDNGANGFGIEISGFCNYIRGCDINNNTPYGVYLENANYAHIHEDTSTSSENRIFDNRYGLVMYYTDDCYIEDTSIFSNGVFDATQALKLSGSSDNEFHGVKIYHNDNSAVALYSGSDENYFKDCEINGNCNGDPDGYNRIHLSNDCDENHFEDCDFKPGSADYSDVLVSTNCDSNNFTFSDGSPVIIISTNSNNNEIHNTDLTAIQVIGSSNTRVVNCDIDDTDEDWAGTGVYLDDADGTEVINCDVTNQVNKGFYIKSSSDVKLRGEEDYSTISGCGRELYVYKDCTVLFLDYSLSNYGTSSPTDIYLDGNDGTASVEYDNIPNVGSFTTYINNGEWQSV